MGEFSIGQSVRRREDPRLLTGRGRYFDDLKLARSVPCRDRALAARARRHQRHRHARGAANAGRARGADRRGLRGRRPRLDARRWRPTRSATAARCTCRSGRRSRIDRVLHVGYPVAVVVADTLDLARDAAERVAVDYAPRPAVVSAREAFEKGAPQLYDDCPDNEAYFYQAGDKAAVDAAFAERRPRGRAAPRHQPRHRQPHRAPRRHRRVRRRHRPLHAALRLPAAMAVSQRHRREPR